MVPPFLLSRDFLLSSDFLVCVILCARFPCLADMFYCEVLLWREFFFAGFYVRDLQHVETCFDLWAFLILCVFC